MKEIQAKLLLAEEIHSREAIIEAKTQENVKITQLSTQFSPQVIQAIQSQKLDIDKPVHREKICAVFIDIVGSTERVLRLAPEKTDLVLARFMDTCFSVLLKHDLTIDKFQGDGILAFSNNPISHQDFVERACLAVLEIRQVLSKDRDYYMLNWQKELHVRAGLAVGFANIGFYGNKKYFKTYTAIGAPLSLAARLTSIAQPDQVLVDAEIAEVCRRAGFESREIGPVTSLKGFENETIVLHSLESHPAII